MWIKDQATRFLQSDLHLYRPQKVTESRIVARMIKFLLTNFDFNLLPNKPLSLRVCSKSLFKTLWEKQMLLVTSRGPAWLSGKVFDS